MSIPLVDLKAQYNSMKDEIDAAIGRVVQSGQFILGPEVEAFEKEMASYLGVEFAVGVASGTDALHLALLTCGIKPGDEVITTPFTFIATAEAIVKCDAVPVFVDIDPKTYNINTEQIEPKITSKTRVILPVHLYGHPAEMKPIIELGQKYKLKIIEDCAQSLGARYRGKKAGTLGNAGCLSFFPAKNLGAYGDGGMVVTNDPSVADVVNVLRKHGSRTAYYYIMSGFNSRLDALQAAILRVKLKHLDRWNEMRSKNALLYNRLLANTDGIDIPCLDKESTSSWNYYTIRLHNPRIKRDKLQNHLKAKGISSAVYYPLSLHLQELYRHLSYHPGDLPQSEKAQEQVLSLPMYPELSEDSINEVVHAIKEFVR